MDLQKYHLHDPTPQEFLMRRSLIRCIKSWRALLFPFRVEGKRGINSDMKQVPLFRSSVSDFFSKVKFKKFLQHGLLREWLFLNRYLYRLKFIIDGKISLYYKSLDQIVWKVRELEWTPKSLDRIRFVSLKFFSYSTARRQRTTVNN